MMLLLFSEKHPIVTKMRQGQKEDLHSAAIKIAEVNGVVAMHNGHTLLLESLAELHRIGRLSLEEYESKYRLCYSERAFLSTEYDRMVAEIKETFPLSILLTLEELGRGLGSLTPLEN